MVVVCVWCVCVCVAVVAVKTTMSSLMVYWAKTEAKMEGRSSLLFHRYPTVNCVMSTCTTGHRESSVMKVVRKWRDAKSMEWKRNSG